jgi:multicomponent Na+:H+ antiporter subunit B
MALFAMSLTVVATALVMAVLLMPSFGGPTHPGRDASVRASVAHRTSNAVSSVNFDQRSLDTLGEECILFASVMGVAMILRPGKDEDERQQLGGGRVLDLTRLGGYVLLPVTMVVGLDVIAQGHLTPGGGFQGGVVVGTGMHLLYVAGRYQALKNARPEAVFEWGEALGAGAFAAMAIAGVLAGSAFLADFLPWGSLGALLSAGTVPALNGAVGIEVASGTIVLLAQFLRQAIEIEQEGGRSAKRSGQTSGEPA